MTPQSVLFVLRHSPYGSDMAKSAIDAALAFAAFEQPLNLLFLGDGVLQLMPGQDGKVIGRKTIYKQLLSLPMYDVERIYVDSVAAQRHRIDLAAFPASVERVSEGEAHALMCDHRHVLGF